MIESPLADLPCEWTLTDDVYSGKYRQRWMPGAFGDREEIRDVLKYRVLREVWQEDTRDGIPERTILEAVALI